MEGKAYQLLKEGEYQEAVELLQQVVNENPSISVLFNLALGLYKLERFEEARSYLEKLLEQEPEHKKGLFLLAVVCRRIGDMKCAREALEKAGLDELIEFVPEPVVKTDEQIEPLEQEGKLQEEETEIVHLDEPHKEEPLEKTDLITEETSEKIRVVRFLFEGRVEFPLCYFLAAILREGNYRKSKDEVILNGKGEVASCFKEVGAVIAEDEGEGQLMIDLKDEKLVIKVNQGEKVIYKDTYPVSWFKF
ncbi:hypothetical protein TST_0854 [Thermosulfidibacter takaii ABI70S6]|uniref:Tetratricopeptide repeat protein n=1 Tax=Thermosulfidibacter takaii (strain DSM 17441 / JCM 13301 / NBRC 103674 / ABI70S6) TaxID=1298851 RepID=A0A0S3QTJ1_THET7|nr:tetratricopeptide repeat protein [Thermosulfidibacter takaii]BAT71654.1 hypothetical protein TST_0854 [Thermosulfidibacter takaii ABI70S6]